MSEIIKHECGIALIRLLQPLEYYQKKYGTALYGLEKLKLLLQKQRNRGQDGVGVATIKLDPKPGTKYISRKRNVTPNNYLTELFDEIWSKHFRHLSDEQLSDAPWMKDNLPYVGELLLGHLRYGTHGDNSIETCHPFLRQNNWINRNLLLAGKLSRQVQPGRDQGALDRVQQVEAVGERAKAVPLVTLRNPRRHIHG